MTQTAPTLFPTVSLRPNPFEPLRLGSVRPAGWLADQLRVQADGLSGHLDEFWPSIADSAWIGGKSESWERGPYWLDGVVPLAVLLRDETLLGKVRKWIDYILGHQRSDGWLGPVLKDDKGRDLYDTWPLFVLFKALTQWHSATGDQRVVPAMLRAMRFIHQHIQEKPIFGWGKYRTADLVISIHWLYEATGEPWLMKFCALVEEQGYDWRTLYDEYPYTGKTENLVVGAGAITGSHGPNAAMGLKQPTLRYRLTSDLDDRDAIFRMIDTLDRYHGQASGVFTCDEHLAGRSPTQGTELCAVVEYLYSLETAFAVLGTDSATLADRWEQIAFNALPAAFSPDMWAHQYDQQSNQICAKRVENPIWTDNNGEANLFGLEPHFGCCTANFHQGWPKFVANAWQRRTEDDALVAMTYAPSVVRTTVQDVGVTIETITDYPFSDRVTLRVSADRPMTVPLLLRIPGWAFGATIEINGVHQTPAAGTFASVSVRTGTEPTEISLRLPMKIRSSERGHRAAVIKRGPLVFSLKLQEQWQQLRGEYPHCDYEVTPLSAWNIAIELNASKPESSFEIRQTPPGPMAFSPAVAPVTLVGHGRVLNDWKIDAVHDVASAPPPSPVTADGQRVAVELIPFGSAKLRVTELPWISV